MFLRKQSRSTDQQDPIRTNTHEISVRIDALVLASCLTILLALTAPRCLANTSTEGNELANTAAESAGGTPTTARPNTGPRSDARSDASTAAETGAPAFIASYSPYAVGDLTNGFLDGNNKPLRPVLSRKCVLFDESLCLAVNNRRVLALATLQTAALISDGVTTRQYLSRGYVEVDPLTRVLLGRTPTWGRMAPLGAVQVIAGMWLAERMATSRHVWVRRLWWLPQMMGTAGNVAASVHNAALR
jgi:hypothetical protein